MFGILRSRLGWALAGVALSACATVGGERVAWPAPPALERIRHLRTLSGQADVDGGLTRFLRRLAGAEPPIQMYHPVGVAVSPGGELLAVTDQALSQLFIFDLTTNAVTTVPSDVLTGVPIGVAIEGEAIYVVVPARQALLKFNRAGVLERTLIVDCERPTGIAIDSGRNRLYLTDTSTTQGHGHVLHVHDLQTGAHESTVGKRGDGPGEFLFPTFVARAPKGGVFVADTMNARVEEFDADGTFVRQFGERGDQFGQFDKPKGIATDSFGNVYVVDSFFSAVQIFNADARLLLFFGGRGDSPGFLSNPAGIAIDAKNRIYVANGLNFRVDVYELVNTEAADSTPPPPSMPDLSPPSLPGAAAAAPAAAR